MRPSRNRYYGHPVLIGFIRKFASAVRTEIGTELLIGDLAQPRGGPMTSGHRSHQTGLDVDIWFMLAAPGGLSATELEDLPAPSMVAPSAATVDPAAWTPYQATALRMAAGFPEVDRIFVNPVIKLELCNATTGDRSWLHKIRPWWGHDAHFHVGLRCPPAEASCIDREQYPTGDGCDQSLQWWFSEDAREELRKSREAPPRRLTLADLPAGCYPVLTGS
jgi:penicillin-insensitive murein endopeptidase